MKSTIIARCTVIAAIALALSACAAAPARFAQSAKPDVVACQTEAVQSNVDQAFPGFVPVGGVTPVLSQRKYEKAQAAVVNACMSARGYQVAAK